MTLPGPGWHTDPADSTKLRWWNGQAWTDHTQMPSPPPAEQELARPAYVPMASHRVVVHEQVKLSRADKERAVRRNNGFAYAAIVLALISAIFNVMGIPSILAIIFGGIGLAKAGSLEGSTRATGRGFSIAALIIGIATLGLLLYKVSEALSAFA